MQNYAVIILHDKCIGIIPRTIDDYYKKKHANARSP